MGKNIISDKVIRQQILEKYNGKCSYCACELNIKTLQIDHIVPFRRKMTNCIKGEHSIDNFNPSCKSCNSSKSSMDLDKWKSEIQKKLDRLHRDSSTYRLAIRFGLVTENRDKTFSFYYEKFI